MPDKGATVYPFAVAAAAKKNEERKPQRIIEKYEKIVWQPQQLKCTSSGSGSSNQIEQNDKAFRAVFSENGNMSVTKTTATPLTNSQFSLALMKRTSTSRSYVCQATE